MARDFVGGPGYLTVPDVALWDASDTLTAMAWVRPTTTDQFDAIFGRHADSAGLRVWCLVLNAATGTLRFDTSASGGFEAGNTATSTGTLTDGVWAHVCCVHNSAAATNRIYINGVQDGSTGSVAAGLFNTDLAVEIGRVNTFASATRYWDGLIAEVALFDVALNASEIMSHAKGVNARLIRPGSCIGYWPIHGTGSPERDYSGKGNHATVSGTVVAATRNPPVVPFIFPTRTTPAAPGLPIDAATVYFDLQPSSVEVFAGIDSAEVYYDLAPSSVEEHIVSDAATIYFQLEALGGECYSTWSAAFVGNGEAEARWYSSLDTPRWFSEEMTRWSEGEITVEGINC